MGALHATGGASGFGPALFRVLNPYVQKPILNPCVSIPVSHGYNVCCGGPLAASRAARRPSPLPLRNDVAIV